MWGISIIAAGSVSQYFGTSFTLNELGCTLYAVILVTVTIKAALMTKYADRPAMPRLHQPHPEPRRSHANHHHPNA